MRKMAMSAVAELTATGVDETWIPVVLSVWCSVRENFEILRVTLFTFVRACCHVDIVISSAIVTDVFQRSRKFRDQLLIELACDLIPFHQLSHPQRLKLLRVLTLVESLLL